jgi:hypothetical protein
LCVLTLTEREDGDVQGRRSGYAGSNGAVVEGVSDGVGRSEGVGTGDDGEEKDETLLERHD